MTKKKANNSKTDRKNKKSLNNLIDKSDFVQDELEQFANSIADSICNEYAEALIAFYHDSNYSPPKKYKRKYDFYDESTPGSISQFSEDARAATRICYKNPDGTWVAGVSVNSDDLDMSHNDKRKNSKEDIRGAIFTSVFEYGQHGAYKNRYAPPGQTLPTPWKRLSSYIDELEMIYK